jgi:hypothetical protein
MAGALLDSPEWPAVVAAIVASAHHNAHAALLDVAEAANARDSQEPFHFEVTLRESDTPTCGECDEDWPCSATNLRAALARLDEVLS